MAWCSTPRTGAVPRSRKKAGAFTKRRRCTMAASNWGSPIARFDFDRIRPGDMVWRTHDPDVDHAARPFTEASAPVARQPVQCASGAREGAPLVTEWSLDERRACALPSSRKPRSDARRTRRSRSIRCANNWPPGETAYELGDVTLMSEGSPFVPVSVLNQLRREAVEKLQARQTHAARDARSDDAACELAAARREARAVNAHAAELHLLVRTPEQLEAALDCALPASRSIISILWSAAVGGTRKSQRHRGAGRKPARSQARRSAHPEFSAGSGLPDSGALGRNARCARRAEAPALLIGDFSLNAANSLSPPNI